MQGLSGLSSSGTVIPSSKSYTLVSSPKRLHWLFGKLQDSPEFAFDIETNHPTNNDRIEPEDVVIGCMSFSWAKDQAACLPLYTGFEKNTFWPDPAVFNRILDRLADVLDGSAEKVAQNGKFDVKWIWQVLGIKVGNFVFDTMLAHHLLDENRLSSKHGLKDMAAHYLDPDARRYEEAKDRALAYYDPSLKRFTSIPMDMLYPYACSDSDYTLQLKHLFKPMLESEGLINLFQDVVMPLQQTCMFAELRGMQADISRVDELDVFYVERKKEVEAHILKESGGVKIDLASYEQMQKLLYVDLKLPQQFKNGKPTTDKSALEALRDKHSVIKYIEEYRHIDQLWKLYVKGIRERYVKTTGKIHADFLVHGTVTGRLATADPNVQNLPTAQKGGAIIKSMFIASPGCKWIMSDYSQVELRCAAHCADEPVWIAAFKAGIDLHSATAHKCFDLKCEPKEVKGNKTIWKDNITYDDKRTDAKKVNFGILYGMSVWGLAAELKISAEEAEVFLKAYYSGLQNLKAWIDGTHSFARQNGYVVNPFGRRRRLPDLMEFVPPRQQKPNGAPDCWSKRGEPPPVIKQVRGLELKTNLHLFTPENASFWQQQAVLIRNPKYQKCTTCGFISNCVLGDEQGRLQSKIQNALRQSVNAIVQSFAADLAAMAFSQVIVAAKQHGIPLMLTSDVRGLAPVNIVHDDIIVEVADEYVDNAKNLIRDTMINIYPEMKVPLEVDQDVVTCWGHKHSHGEDVKLVLEHLEDDV
jgi:DNA polymerase I-like protein with 3'-5' exonuclease and polymerase domains